MPNYHPGQGPGQPAPSARDPGGSPAAGGTGAASGTTPAGTPAELPWTLPGETVAGRWSRRARARADLIAAGVEALWRDIGGGAPPAWSAMAPHSLSPWGITLLVLLRADSDPPAVRTALPVAAARLGLAEGMPLPAAPAAGLLLDAAAEALATGRPARRTGPGARPPLRVLVSAMPVLLDQEVAGRDVPGVMALVLGYGEEEG
ncbi:MAG TPA: hypothetical protein VEB20_02320 [Azospirillaceae bacterium]|nr:hypothetical protein [Azospirillaceae bacterium]